MNKLSKLLVFLAFFLTGCSVFSTTEEPPKPQTTLTSTSAITTPESTDVPVAVTPTSGPVTLLIWLPPWLSTDANPEAGRILLERLSLFSQQNPGVSVSVRIKAEDGSGGMIDSLATANAAAPLAVPDLIALSYESMQVASLKGLLHSYDGLSDSMNSTDWYDYAQDLAHFQNSTVGLPFAGDAQVLVFRSEIVEAPPLDWATALQSTGPYVFPAADPQAIFTLSQYQAEGGEVQDNEGHPFLDQEKLTQTLTFYQQAEEVDFMPFWLTQLQTDEQAWQALLEDRTSMVVTWSSRYLAEAIPTTELAPILTPNGRPFTLTNGWIWALATVNPEHRELSVQLAEFLTESDFLAEWTQALGILPPRPSAMESWSNAQIRTKLDRINASAQMLPPSDVLNRLGPLLEKAVGEVLKQQNDPASAAKEAVDSLAQP